MLGCRECDQCKNITKRRERARTGRRTERKQDKIGRNKARICPTKKRNKSNISEFQSSRTGPTHNRH